MKSINLVIFGWLALALTVLAWVNINQGLKPIPTLAVGECFTLDPNKEAWEHPVHIQKVIQIGKESYQTGLYVPSSGTFYVANSSLDSVSFRDSVVKINCPTKE